MTDIAQAVVEAGTQAAAAVVVQPLATAEVEPTATAAVVEVQPQATATAEIPPLATAQIGCVSTGIMVEAITATVDGLTTGLIDHTTDFADITSANSAYIATFPAATVGKLLRGAVGANGCVLATAETGSYVLPANCNFIAESTTGSEWDVSVRAEMLTRTNIAAKLNALIANDYHFIVPPGIFELSESLDFVNKTGRKFSGSGFQSSLNPIYSYNGISTQFWWSGSDGEPVMIVQGGEKYFSDFIMHPDSHDEISQGGDFHWIENGNVPKCAIEMRHTDVPTNLGTGDFIFERITIESFPIGVQLGDYDGIRQQCDVTSWNNITFDSCPVGFQLEHLQVLGHSFEKINFRKESTGKAFNVRGGGKLTCDNVNMTHGGTCLYFDPANTDQFGPNTYDYRFSMVQADQAASYNFMLFDSNPATVGSMAANVIFNGGGPQNEDYAANDARLGIVYGRQRVTLREVTQLQVGHFAWATAGGHTPTLFLDNCTIARSTSITDANDLLKPSASTGDLHFTVRGMKDWAGNPLPDIGPVLVAGTA